MDRTVRFDFMHFMPYVHYPENHKDYKSTWVDFPNKYYDPKKGHALYQRYLSELVIADQVGCFVALTPTLMLQLSPGSSVLFMRNQYLPSRLETGIQSPSLATSRSCCRVETICQIRIYLLTSDLSEQLDVAKGSHRTLSFSPL